MWSHFWNCGQTPSSSLMSQTSKRGPKVWVWGRKPNLCNLQRSDMFASKAMENSHIKCTMLHYTMRCCIILYDTTLLLYYSTTILRYYYPIPSDPILSYILDYTILHSTILYCTLLYHTILYQTIPSYTIPYHKFPNYTTLLYNIQYSTVLYYTALYLLYFSML